MSDRIDYTWEEIYAIYCGEETLYTIEFALEVDFSPVVPARTSGPPEDCSPAEGGEVDLCSVTVTAVSRQDDDGQNHLEELTDSLAAYWVARFYAELDGTTKLKDWLDESIAELEQDRDGPDDDDRDDERWGI